MQQGAAFQSISQGSQSKVEPAGLRARVPSGLEPDSESSDTGPILIVQAAHPHPDGHDRPKRFTQREKAKFSCSQ